MKSFLFCSLLFLLLSQFAIAWNNDDRGEGGNGGSGGGSGGGDSDEFSQLCTVNYLLPNFTFICSDLAEDIELETVTIPANPGRDVFSVPENESLVLTWEAHNLFGDYLGNSTVFFFQISAGEAVGVTAAASIDYDWDGDGEWDRTEIYDIFATNPIPGEFETWEGNLNFTTDISGEYEDFEGGNIRLRVWSAFGGAPLTLRIGASDSELVSNISFPFNFNSSCCAQIDALQSELQELMEEIDRLNSRLAATRQSCCEAVIATATATATETELDTAVETATGTLTATGTSTATDTEVGTATAA